MIFITGDTHGDVRRFSSESFPEQKKMTKDDYVIILGDFGLIWEQKESKVEKYWLDWLNDKPFTTLFIDGNHENFNRLNSLPVMDWHGGQVHKVRDSVFHLMRGHVFDINNTKFFTLGGAHSHDIKDGILDLDDPNFKAKRAKLDKNPYSLYRIRNVSWWDAEIPSNEEIEFARKKIEEIGKVDYVLTHCPPPKVFIELGLSEKIDIFSNFLNEIKVTLGYKNWFFGHLHSDMKIDDKLCLLYEQIIEVPENQIILDKSNDELEI